MPVWLSVLVPVVSVVISFVSLLFVVLRFGRDTTKDHKAEDEKETENRVKVNVKLDSLCATTAGIASDIKGMQSSMYTTNTKIALIEKELATVWKQINEIKERMDNL